MTEHLRCWTQMQTKTLSAEAASSDASLGTRYRRMRSGT
jgi:hypothetical protein